MGKQKIAPLLFIPFVENSFKHGIKGETGDSYVNIHLEVADDELLVKVFTKNKVLITHDTLKSIEVHLPGQHFIRIHKSFIISIRAIQYIEGNQVQIVNDLLPIGLTYKDKLIEILGRK